MSKLENRKGWQLGGFTNKKLIYIPDEEQETWEEIEKAAQKEKRGIGTFICMFWEKIKGGGE